MVRYLERHTLFRSLARFLGGFMRVFGLVVLAIAAVAIWVAVRWPTVALLLFLFWLWRRRHRRHYRERLARLNADTMAAVRAERDRLTVEFLRARVLRAQLGAGPDVIAAERDYRAGRISRHDYDTALAYAAEEVRERTGPRFKFH